MTRLQAGVIGAGILGSEHASYLARHRDVELVAIADIRHAAAKSLAGRHGAAAYGDLGNMLKEQQLDLVTVATPDPLHRKPSLAAIQAGVPNVIQEKPLATCMEDAEAIYEAVEKQGTRFFVNYGNRADPLDIASHYVIQQGLLGEAVYAESRLDDNISVPTQMWGGRSKEWAAGSSTAHFLLSHVVDLFRWYFAPAEVTQVYATSQEKVLGYTPDLYDAFLIFDNGIRTRVKAEWIKHIDELVDFYISVSGSEGTIIYNKHAAFGASPGWRANLSKRLSLDELVAHQQTLLDRGANVSALLQKALPGSDKVSAGEEAFSPSLEYRGAAPGKATSLIGYCIDAILEDTLQPENWSGLGSLPTHVDGLKQVQIVMAIIESARSGRVIDLT